MSTYEPGKVLKQISNSLLRQFFVKRNELHDINWDDLTEHKIESIYEAITKLDDKTHSQVLGILRDIHFLASHKGYSALVEQMKDRYPEREPDFYNLKGKADTAMWSYLNMPDGYELAIPFARADALLSGRSWKCRKGLPSVILNDSAGVCEQLSQGLSMYYTRAQKRGRVCEVVYQQRLGKTDFYFAYLDNYSDNELVKDDESNELVVRSVRHTFENVFAYTPATGVLEASFKGGEEAWLKLQPIFCNAVLGLDIDPAPSWKPVFKLDQLLDPNFSFPTETADRIDSVRLTMLRLGTTGSKGHVEIKVDQPQQSDGVHHKISQWIKAEKLSLSTTRVLMATFQLVFIHEGDGEPPTMSFDVSARNSCTLKSKPDEQRVIGERCLQRWEICDDIG